MRGDTRITKSSVAPLRVSSSDILPITHYNRAATTFCLLSVPFADGLINAVEAELTEENVEVDNTMQEVGVSRDRRRQIWDYLRQKAGRAATSLGTLAVTILCSATVTGIAEKNNTLWIASLSVVVFLLAAASVASYLALQEVTGQGSQVTSEDSQV